jgi:hypothetical protein
MGTEAARLRSWSTQPLGSVQGRGRVARSAAQKAPAQVPASLAFGASHSPDAERLNDPLLSVRSAGRAAPQHADDHEGVDAARRSLLLVGAGVLAVAVAACSVGTPSGRQRRPGRRRRRLLVPQARQALARPAVRPRQRPPSARSRTSPRGWCPAPPAPGSGTRTSCWSTQQADRAWSVATAACSCWPRTAPMCRPSCTRTPSRLRNGSYCHHGRARPPCSTGPSSRALTNRKPAHVSQRRPERPSHHRTRRTRSL